MLKNLISIMIGGAVGAAFRYLIGIMCSHWRISSWPSGTFIVNIVGCFLLGLFMGIGERYVHFSGSTYLMLTVGLCGAFTTFSTFTADTFRLMNDGHWALAIGYLTLSIVVGFILFWVGRKIIL